MIRTISLATLLLSYATATAAEPAPSPEAAPGQIASEPSALAAIDPVPAATPLPATAADTDSTVTATTSEPRRRELGLTLALKAGGLFPQLFSNLGVAATAQLEVGYLLWQRRIAVFVDAGYAQPTTSGSFEDARVAGSQVSWDVKVRQLNVSLGVLARFQMTRLTPYAGAAWRVQMQQTITNGSAGTSALGENRASGTSYGGATLLGGAELKVGPGAVLGELQVGYSAIANQSISGSANAAAIGLLVGYRLTL